MTVIAQDDHLTAGAWAACGLTGSSDCSSNSKFLVDLGQSQSLFSGVSRDFKSD